MIEDNPKYAHVDILVKALDDRSPTLVRQVFNSLNIIFGEEFKSKQEFLDWWQTNQGNYDDDLLENN